MDAAAGAVGGMGGGYSNLVGGAITLMNGIMAAGSKKGPELRQVTLPGVNQGQTDFLSQEANLPGVSSTVQQANDLSTEMFHKNLAQFAPDIEQTNRNIGANASDMLAGNVANGEGQGFNGRALTARDLGLTSDDLMSSGVGMSASALEGARSLNPFNHGSVETLLSPGSLLARGDSHLYEDNDRRNQQRLIQSKASGINPYLAGIMAGTQNLLGGMGGMGGGGGGGMGGMMSSFGGGGGGAAGAADAAGGAAEAAGSFG